MCSFSASCSFSQHHSIYACSSPIRCEGKCPLIVSGFFDAFTLPPVIHITHAVPQLAFRFPQLQMRFGIKLNRRVSMVPRRETKPILPWGPLQVRFSETDQILVYLQSPGIFPVNDQYCLVKWYHYGKTVTNSLVNILDLLQQRETPKCIIQQCLRDHCSELLGRYPSTSHYSSR